MNSCLLCTKIIQDSNNCVMVNSEQWNKKNMKFLIEKHLWQMDTIKTSSAVCQGCGEQLSNYHTFYKRIWKAQTNVTKHVQKEHVSLQSNYCDNEQVKDKVNDKDNDFRKNGDIEPKTPIVQIISNEYPIIQLIPNDTNFDKNECIINQIQKIYDDPVSNDDILKDNTASTNEIAAPMMTSSNTCKQTVHTQAKIKNFRIRLKKCLPSINPDESSLNTNTKPDLELTEHNSGNKDSLERNRKKSHRNDAKTTAEYDRIITENFKIKCHLCNNSFETFSALLKHFRMEHNRRGHARCCGRNFYIRSHLVAHLLGTHMNTGGDFKCNDCGEVFSNQKILECHSKIHNDKSKLFKCDICRKDFVKPEEYDIHLKCHFTEKPFKCSICDKFFSTPIILRNHIHAVHENKYAQICEVCGKSIRCPSNFPLHMEKHNPQKNLVSCDICGLLLSNEVGLKRHKRHQHPEGGKKDHKCHICSKVSPTKASLATHIREKHRKRTSVYKCTVCGKICKKKRSLAEHMATHTGTVRYKCDWCPKECRTYVNMYYHRKKVHPKEWAEHIRGKYEIK